MQMQADELARLLDYDAETGILTWRRRSPSMMERPELCACWNRQHAGRPAGTKNSHGYMSIRIGRRQIGAHRVAWLLSNGEIPGDHQIDHLNGVRDDNRLANLRLATVAENNRNMRLQRRNSSGLHGVAFSEQYQCFVSRITVNKKLVHLGHFPSLLDAAAARKSAELAHSFHPNHGRQ